MKTNHCYVCGCDIGLYGWSKHVQKEKRLFGNDIYDRLKKDRSITPEKLKEESVLKNGGLTLKEYIVQ